MRKKLKKAKTTTSKKYMPLPVFFLFLIICIFFVLILLEKKIMPISYEVSEKYAATEINRQIDTACRQVIDEMGIKQEDFFIKSNSDSSSFLSVNTLVINDICSKLGVKISENLNNLPKGKIAVPLGALTGLDFLSNFGPDIAVRLHTIGSSQIDYETKFLSAGINQVNFQVYLNINSEITVVNPLCRKRLNIKRKLMLVNTVFNGEVPSAYVPVPRS